jgi:hypothetical protein
MFARTRLNVTLYIHCRSCLLFLKFGATIARTVQWYRPTLGFRFVRRVWLRHIRLSVRPSGRVEQRFSPLDGYSWNFVCVWGGGGGWNATKKEIGWNATKKEIGWNATKKGIGWNATKKEIGWNATKKGIGWNATKKGIGWNATKNTTLICDSISLSSCWAEEIFQIEVDQIITRISVDPPPHHHFPDPQIVPFVRQ